MGGDKPSGEEPPKREILNPDDSLRDISTNADDRAEAAARAARRLREDEEKRRREQAQEQLGWYGRLWQRFRAFMQRNFGGPVSAITGFFTRRLPRTAHFFGMGFGALERLWMGAIWPFIVAISHRTGKDGRRRLSLTGRLLIAAVILAVAWPLFKIYYVLGTQRDFHHVQVTFKQIIDRDRYLVFGDHTDAQGQRENMAFNITDSWVYWNWTPDLMFAQIPLVGRCDLRTYGWYVRVPRFVPFFGRTLLVEPVVIQANCAETPGLAPVTPPAE
jgi:hypothetical protein